MNIHWNLTEYRFYDGKTISKSPITNFKILRIRGQIEENGQFYGFEYFPLIGKVNFDSELPESIEFKSAVFEIQQFFSDEGFHYSSNKSTAYFQIYERIDVNGFKYWDVYTHWGQICRRTLNFEDILSEFRLA